MASHERLLTHTLKGLDADSNRIQHLIADADAPGYDRVLQTALLRLEADRHRIERMIANIRQLLHNARIDLRRTPQDKAKHLKSRGRGRGEAA